MTRQGMNDGIRHFIKSFFPAIIFCIVPEVSLFRVSLLPSPRGVAASAVRKTGMVEKVLTQRERNYHTCDNAPLSCSRLILCILPANGEKSCAMPCSMLPLVLCPFLGCSACLLARYLANSPGLEDSLLLPCESPISCQVGSLPELLRSHGNRRFLHEKQVAFELIDR